MGFSSIHEHEFEYVFKKGMLNNSAYFDNPLSTSTLKDMYEPCPTAVIDSLINSAALPAIQEDTFVGLEVVVDERGKVDSVLEISGHSNLFNQEALRVAHLLTDLPFTYKQ